MNGTGNSNPKPLICMWIVHLMVTKLWERHKSINFFSVPKSSKPLKLVHEVHNKSKIKPIIYFRLETEVKNSSSNSSLIKKKKSLLHFVFPTFSEHYHNKQTNKKSFQIILSECSQLRLADTWQKAHLSLQFNLQGPARLSWVTI